MLSGLSCSELFRSAGDPRHQDRVARGAKSDPTQKHRQRTPAFKAFSWGPFIVSQQQVTLKGLRTLSLAELYSFEIWLPRRLGIIHSMRGCGQPLTSGRLQIAKNFGTQSFQTSLIQVIMVYSWIIEHIWILIMELGYIPPFRTFGSFGQETVCLPFLLVFWLSGTSAAGCRTSSIGKLARHGLQIYMLYYIMFCSIPFYSILFNCSISCHSILP